MRALLLGLFSHRTLAILRWDIHFMLLRLLNFLTGADHRFRRFVASRERPVYLNLGSGPRGLDDPHWVNIDGFPNRNVHFALDFSRPMALPANTFAGCFSEHVVEHFNLEDGETLARQIHDTLLPGGVFRIVVPDGRWILQSYFGDPDFGGRRDGATAMEAVNSYFRQRYEHQFIYDFETMSAMLRRAGFERVEAASFGKGSELATLDAGGYEPESLYVDAYKAG